MDGNSSAALHIQFLENGLGTVRDCESGQASRMVNCVLSIVSGALSGVLVPLLLLVGVPGNLLVAHVMLLRLRPLTRQNLYLGCIAIVDLLSLIFNGIFNGFLNKGLPWLTRGRVSFMLYNLGNIACKASRGLTNFLHLLTCLWLLVLVSDRVLVVLRPLAMKQVGRRWAGGALLVSLLVAALIALPISVLTGHQQAHFPGFVVIYCYTVPLARQFMMFYKIILSNPPTAFILIILVLDLVLLCKVTSVLRKRNTMTPGQPKIGGAATSGTIVVLIIGCVYLVLHTPLIIVRPMLEVALDMLDRNADVNYITVVGNLTYAFICLSLVNQCVSVFVLLSRSAQFKQATLELLRCRSRGSYPRHGGSSYGVSELRSGNATRSQHQSLSPIPMTNLVSASQGTDAKTD